MTIRATPEQQRQLLTLQQFDQQLVQLRSGLEALRKDQELSALRQEGAGVVQQAKSIQAKVAQCQAAAGEAERVVEQTGTRRDGMQHRLDRGEVATRDIQAVTIEIAELTVRIETLEEDQLTAIQVLENAQQELETATAKITDAEQAVNVRIAALNEQGQQLATQGKELSVQRSELAKSLPAGLVAEYDRLRSQNQGVGALELTEQALSGAGVPIAPAELAAIHRTPADELAYCPDTDAILVRS